MRRLYYTMSAPCHIFSLRSAALSALALAALPCLLGACREEDKVSTENISVKHMPTMTTRNVMTIITDSGIPQYRLVGPVWYVYDDIDTPVWILPGGPYLEKFDPDFNVAFTLACDSAVNNQVTGEWELYGNVEYNEPGRMLILADELIWNQRSGMIRSDKFIHLEQPSKIIEGYGFDGRTDPRGNLTEYRLRKPSGFIPYSKPDPSEAERPEGISSVSVSAPSAASSRPMPVPVSPQMR